MVKKLIIASSNPGKIMEIKEILSDINIEILSLQDINFVKVINERGCSYFENAKIKAIEVAKKTGFITLADDSGLEIDALYGRPGIKSARFAKGSDFDRCRHILKILRNVPQGKRTARFRAVVLIYDPDKNKEFSFEGVSEGYITDRLMGINGFGYDPIFYNSDLGKTNAQATSHEKNRVSHRARALIKAKEKLLDLLA